MTVDRFLAYVPSRKMLVFTAFLSVLTIPLYKYYKVVSAPRYRMAEGIDLQNFSEMQDALSHKSVTIQSIDNQGMMPLERAACYGYYQSAQFLIDHGADLNKGGRQAPLTMAAERGDDSMIDLLFVHGVVVNNDGHDGSSALWHAAIDGQESAVDLLLARGANPRTYIIRANGKKLYLLGELKKDHEDHIAEIIAHAVQYHP